MENNLVPGEYWNGCKKQTQCRQPVRTCKNREYAAPKESDEYQAKCGDGLADRRSFGYPMFSWAKSIFVPSVPIDSEG